MSRPEVGSPICPSHHEPIDDYLRVEVNCRFRTLNPLSTEAVELANRRTIRIISRELSLFSQSWLIRDKS